MNIGDTVTLDVRKMLETSWISQNDPIGVHETVTGNIIFVDPLTSADFSIIKEYLEENKIEHDGYVYKLKYPYGEIFFISSHVHIQTPVCICDIMLLMQSGCRCGAISRRITP